MNQVRTIFYVARLYTRHFEFEAYGESESAAQAALLAGLHRHAKQYEIANKGWPREAMADAEVREVILGAAYRDRDIIKVQP